MILVIGGAGFVGSNFITQWIGEEKTAVLNYDKLTVDANLNNLSNLEHHSSYHFVKGDIRNRELLRETINKYRPSAIIHFGAKLPSDRSIINTETFLQINTLGTFELLEETLAYWRQLPPDEKKSFRFLNISTSEVYGLADANNLYATENSAYAPINPFAASKAAADHFVRSFHKTYGLPTLSTYCSNNFGPYQFPTKLIPLVILSAIKGDPLEINGEERNCIPWIYVGEHCAALRFILRHGIPGESYNIGSQAILNNKSLIEKICSLLDEMQKDSPCMPHSRFMNILTENTKVIQKKILDDTKLRQLGWKPKENFDASLRKTIYWYLHNISWLENVVSGDYKHWIQSVPVN